MSWKKFVRPVNSVLPASQRTVGGSKGGYGSTVDKHPSFLPAIYAGQTERRQRYVVYEQMAIDHEISAALDTIADFGAEPDAITELPLILKYNDTPTPSEVQVIEKSLGQWCRLNKINKRLWRMFRSTLVYGDQFFIRDPETFKLYWIDPAKVEKVMVNESDGKKIESYYVKDIDLNMQSLVATNQLNKNSLEAMGGNSIIYAPPLQTTVNYLSAGTGNVSPTKDSGIMVVDAKHIVQLSLTEGMNSSWPFGMSILEQIYKVYKQKELLEDAILIYRVHRAPERRIFKIDVGQSPPNKAQQYLERIKYEVQQKRIPSKNGMNGNIVDSTYNPMCLALDTKIPLLDGRVLTLNEIIDEFNAGKENWVHSKDINLNDEPGKIAWAGITRKNAEVLRVKLSNNIEVIATPDHKFIDAEGKEINAENLLQGIKLLSINDINIEVINIERLSYVMDTGDITVESKSNSHIFALDSGIFVHNSQLEDYYFAISCLTLDTMVPLLDGRTLPLSELIDEYINGKENYTYTVNQDTHELIPGKIVWGGITRKNAELVEVVLDNGEKLRLTPDHRFIMRDGSEKEAQHLIPGESLMPLYLNHAKTSAKQKGKPYLRHIDNATGKIKWVHTTICPKSKSGKETEIHHIDFNSRNNNPTNLIEMDTEAHRELHRATASDNVTARWKDPEGRATLLKGMQDFYDNRTKEDDEMLSSRNSKNASSGHANMTESERQDWIDALIKGHADIDIKLRYSEELISYILSFVVKNKSSIRKIKDLSNLLQIDEEFMILWKDANTHIVEKNDSLDYALSIFTVDRIRDIFSKTEYSTWENYSKIIGIEFERHDFRPGNAKVLKDNMDVYDLNPTKCLQCDKTMDYKKRDRKFCNNSCASTYNNLRGVIGCKKAQNNKKIAEDSEFYNHKVVSVRFLTEHEDTGDITIESEGGYHNFATAAGVYVHNSDGRGSSVEVLPGGDNLGCFSLDTKVKLIDGRDLTILEIRTELEQGRTLFTYSCHPTTGEIAPGLISGAGMTQKEASVMNLTLSNGETIVCTPEHKFPIAPNGFIEAQNLNIGDQLNSRHGEKIFVTDKFELFDKISVGTLTIDTHETFHNWHTYLLSSGVFVKNSIDDLKYFNNKMLRALGVPSSYLPTGPDDGTAGMSDGKVGTAFIQEYRFSKVVTRYQNQIIEPLDTEFKLFLKHRGVNIDNSTFELKFTPAQSFSDYRQLELDSAKVNVFTALTDIPFVSKRFVLQRYLGWTEGELAENEKMWKEERSRLTKTFTQPGGGMGASSGGMGAGLGGSAANSLSGMGITSSGIDNMNPEGETDEELPGDDLGNEDEL